MVTNYDEETKKLIARAEEKGFTIIPNIRFDFEGIVILGREVFGITDPEQLSKFVLDQFEKFSAIVNDLIDDHEGTKVIISAMENVE